MRDELKYNAEQRREYLNMIDRVGRNWLEIFHDNTEFYSAVYWDLLTRIWKIDCPVRKTDAVKFMIGVKSPQTAAKYIENALRQNILHERDNPEDARSKLLVLSAEMKKRLDAFFDTAVSHLRRAEHEIRVKGPSPEEP